MFLHFTPHACECCLWLAQFQLSILPKGGKVVWCGWCSSPITSLLCLCVEGRVQGCIQLYTSWCAMDWRRMKCVCACVCECMINDRLIARHFGLCQLHTTQSICPLSQHINGLQLKSIAYSHFNCRAVPL